MPITQISASSRPPTPGQWTPIANATASRTAAGINERSAAELTMPASSAERGAGEASRRSNQPCSMSRARLTPVAAPVNPAPWSMLTGMMKLW